MLPALISRKRRQSVLGGALDVYVLPNPGLRVFEVEFSSPETAAAYTPPNGVGNEITNEPTLTGYALAGAV
jgi:adenylate cyclase